jgi:hypothetical protein
MACCKDNLLQTETYLKISQKNRLQMRLFTYSAEICATRARARLQRLYTNKASDNNFSLFQSAQGVRGARERNKKCNLLWPRHSRRGDEIRNTCAPDPASIGKTQLRQERVVGQCGGEILSRFTATLSKKERSHRTSTRASAERSRLWRCCKKSLLEISNLLRSESKKASVCMSGGSILCQSTCPPTWFWYDLNICWQQHTAEQSTAVFI